jgi:hypothetical protein
MRDYRDYDDYEFGPLKHSGLGIVSLTLAIGGGVMMAILIFIVAVLENSRPGGLDPETPAGAALMGGFCFALLLAMIGVGLGIAGVCQSNRKTVLAILGLVLNGLILLGSGCLVLIGIASNGF